MPANLPPPERYRAGNGVAITRHTDAKLPPEAKRRMVPRKHRMDVQRKPGLLEVCVLAAIRGRDKIDAFREDRKEIMSIYKFITREEEV